MAKKVLIFGTYPIVNPQHGGQQRVSAIVSAYKKAGMSVKYVAVFQRNFYPDHSADDIALPEPPGGQSLLEVYTADMLVSRRMYEEADAREAVKAIVGEFRPDIIEIEQMFPYFGLRQLLEDLRWKGKLVYSSHNVEYELKQSILEGTDVSAGAAKAAVSAVKDMEIELTHAADLVIACTEQDAAFYKKAGAKKVVVAPNGIHARHVGSESIDRWRDRFTKSGITAPVLYIGSAHPPNLTGFAGMVGFGLGFLPPYAKLFFIGGVSDIIAQKLADQPNYLQTTFRMRAEFLGRVSESDLGALLAAADTIILPITEGGGSNLKTAEAILSGKKIVATRHALRSYEAYESLPNITTVNDAGEFRTAIHDAVAKGAVELTKKDRDLSGQVTWDHVLLEAVEGVKEL